jgi:hypothetical protein
VVELSYKLSCLFGCFRFVLQEVDKFEARVVVNQHQQPSELLAGRAAEWARNVRMDEPAGV